MKMDTQIHQTNNLSYIPAALFTILQLVYNFYHVKDSVFWAIFYFSSIYLVLILWTIIEYLRAKDKLSKLYHVGIGMGLILLIYLELKSRVAKSVMEEKVYSIYMDKVNSMENSILFALLILVVMITLLSRLWKN